MTPRPAFVAYVWWAAMATVFFFTAGYATIGFGLLFFGVVWNLLRRRSFPWHSTPLDPPLAVFAAMLLASALASPYRPIALSVTPLLLVSGAVYYGSFVWLLDHEPTARMSLLRAWAVGAVPAALAGLVVMRIANVHAEEGDHLRAFIPHGVGPNGLGTTLLLGSLLALGLGVAPRLRIWERALWLGCSMVGVVGLVATESRASIGGWLVGVGWLLGSKSWAALRPPARTVAAILAAGIVGLVIAAVLIPKASIVVEDPLVSSARKIDPNLMERVLNTATDLAANRFKIWGTSLRMVAASPWLGTGFGTFEAAYARRRTPEVSREPFAFNLALNLAVETGLLGLYAAVWVGQAGVVEWRRRGREVSSGSDASRPIVAALWVGLLVSQLADNTLFSIGTSAALWLLLALLVVPARLSPDHAGDHVAPGGARYARQGLGAPG